MTRTAWTMAKAECGCTFKIMYRKYGSPSFGVDERETVVCETHKTEAYQTEKKQLIEKHNTELRMDLEYLHNKYHDIEKHPYHGRPKPLKEMLTAEEIEQVDIQSREYGR